MDTTADAPPARIFVDPTAWDDPMDWHREAAALRAHHPVVRMEAEGFEPFWAVTRHADVMDVSRRSDVFENTERSVLIPDFQFDFLKSLDFVPRTLVHMDGIEHREHRAVTADWFKPKAAAARQPQIEAIADEFVARLDELGGTCDLAQDIFKPYALRVIMSIFGVPPSDEDLMMDLTQGLFGAADPEYLGDLSDPFQLVVKTVERFRTYFAELSGARRAVPTEDLATVIANGQVHGCPMGASQELWYFIIVATAGHDTTSFSLSGGLEALLRAPDQLDELRRRPDLVVNAGEEMVRWTSSVRSFLRYPTEDTVVGGVPIAKGERVLLSYPSANRDEAVFERPDEFDITRGDVGNLISFGVGLHHCLGAQVARNEIRAMLPRLLAKVEHLELDGTPEWSRSTFVGGVKKLPVRYTLAR